MEILRQLLLALEQAQSLTDVNIAAGQLRQELDAQGKRTTEQYEALYVASQQQS